MPLRIDVLKYRGHAVTEPVSVVFDREGGTIGRSVDNKLVLSDDCVSRKHARISFHAGRYYLTDESANGTLIYNRDLLVHYDRVELDEGDILRIGDYELGVTYEERIDNTHAVRAEKVPSRPRFEDEPDRDSPPERAAPAPPRKEVPSLLVKDLSIDDFFKDTGEVPPLDRGADKKRPSDPGAPKKAPDVQLNERKVDGLFNDIDDFFRDSATIEARDLRPEPGPQPPPEGEQERHTFEKPRAGRAPAMQTEERAVHPEAPVEEQPPVAAREAPAPVVPPPVSHAQAPPAESVPGPDVTGLGMPPVDVPSTAEPEKGVPGVDEIRAELFHLFLEGARMEKDGFFDNAEIPELMETLGAVFRELVTGLHAVLRGRTELKAEFRLAMTMVRPFRNNPLKLSPRIEDALKRLLKRDHPSFLEPVDAVREGFEDIMNHQLAMNAGMRASLTEVLDKFDPQRFAEKHKDSSYFQTKGKYWTDYCDAYGDLREQAAEGIFGKAFVQAYEEQLEKLRSKDKKD